MCANKQNMAKCKLLVWMCPEQSLFSVSQFEWNAVANSGSRNAGRVTLSGVGNKSSQTNELIIFIIRASLKKLTEEDDDTISGLVRYLTSIQSIDVFTVFCGRKITRTENGVCVKKWSSGRHRFDVYTLCVTIASYREQKKKTAAFVISNSLG